jgi:cysteine-rich repeat protein
MAKLLRLLLLVVWAAAAVEGACGDGKRLGNEGCDDGNAVNGDGCSAKCRIESSYVCTNAVPNVCTKIGKCCYSAKTKQFSLTPRFSWAGTADPFTALNPSMPTCYVEDGLAEACGLTVVSRQAQVHGSTAALTPCIHVLY